MQIERLKLGSATPENDWEKGVDKTLDRLFQIIYEFLNNGLKIEDNSSVSIVTLTTSGTPDTETAIAHTLKRTPIGYFVVSKDKAGIIYDGSTSWTSTNIYLRSDVASVTTKVIIF